MILTIDVPDDQLGAVEQALSTVPSVTILEPAPTKEQRVENLREAIEQVNLAKAGKIQLKSAQQLLDEL